MQYYELPAGLLDDPEALRPWVESAIDVAGRAKSRTKGKSKGKEPGKTKGKGKG